MVRRLSFLSPNASPAKPWTHLDIILDVFNKVWGLGVALVIAILVSAFLYLIGIQNGWGIEPTFATPDKPSFSDCLHFSTITITTLGYGDYRPISYGRIVAGCEALSGLVLTGIFISRLVSRQQDRLTKRLVRGLFNGEIQEFRDQLAALKPIFNNPPPLVLNQPSPLLYRAGGLAWSIGKYWRHEAREPDLAEIVQSSAAGRLLGDLIVLMTNIQALVVGKQRSQVNAADIIQIRRAAEASLTAATVVLDRVNDQSAAHSYSAIEAIVRALRQQLDLRRTF